MNIIRIFVSFSIYFLCNLLATIEMCEIWWCGVCIPIHCNGFLLLTRLILKIDHCINYNCLVNSITYNKKITEITCNEHRLLSPLITQIIQKNKWVLNTVWGLSRRQNNMQIASWPSHLHHVLAKFNTATCIQHWRKGQVIRPAGRYWKPTQITVKLSVESMPHRHLYRWRMFAHHEKILVMH